MVKLNKILLAFFVLSLMNCGANQVKNEEVKNEILINLENFNNWYNNGFVLKGFQPEESWYFMSRNEYEFPYSKDNDGFRKYLEIRLGELNKLNLLASNYYSLLNKRYNNDKTIINEATLFTNHEYGDCIISFLVERENMDYLVTESPEYNSFMETNNNISEEEYKNWHKDRIVIENTKNAYYKVMYSEIGYQDQERAYNFFIVNFIKEQDNWKINDIRIQESSREEISPFYESNVEKRGYYED